MISLQLPYPPSINNYWRHARGRHYISAQGKAFRQEVWATAGTRPRMDGRLGVDVQVWVPDKRKRDLDNVLKALLDALEHAGIYKDDGQIDDLHITRRGIEPGGQCRVQVWELQDTWKRHI